MKRLIICLDGTWNSAYAASKREDGSKIIKPSNILKMARAISLKDGDSDQVVYYHTGVGSMSKFPGFSNAVLRKMDKTLGGGWGAGFESNVEDAMHFLVNNYVSGDEVFLFGFSRGAATARALTKFIDWLGGAPAKIDAYYLPELFRNYIKFKGEKSSQIFKDGIIDRFNKRNEIKRKQIKQPQKSPPFNDWIDIKIKFIGVWDTVLSLGGRFLPVTNRKHYLSDLPAECVEHARQALAIDEKRFDFQPAIWTQTSHIAQTLKQKWFAGVHSNIGGGYSNDGLANITFHWMRDEILSVCPGFQFENEFFKIFKKYIQAELVDSKKRFYKVKDFIMRKDGTRKIVTQLDSAYEGSGLTVDFTALQRMNSRADKKNKQGQALFPQLDQYQPRNLIQYMGKKKLSALMSVYTKEAELMDEKRRTVFLEKIDYIESFLKQYLKN